MRIRAVAAGPVSPVSTGPHFSSLVACLVLPISAVAWRTPTQRPEAHRYHVETCKMAANNAVPRVFQQLSVLTSQRLISQASPVKGVVSADMKTGSESRVQRNCQNGIHVKLCCLASEKHRIGPKLVSEAIS